MTTPQPEASIGSRMAKGVGWLVLTRLSVRMIGLASTVVLARLLVPEDFGLIALAAIVTGGLDVLSDFKLEFALIHYQKADRRLYDAVWTFSVLRGFAIALMLVITAAPLASFFNDPRLEPILMVLALIPMIDGFQNVGMIEYNKELKFDRNFHLQVVTKLFGLLITVAAAILWRSYWALIYGMLARSIAAVAMTYVVHPFRPRLSLSGSSKLLGFSKWIMFSSLMNFANNKIDAILLGKLEDTQTLGIYNVAREIAGIPTSELVAPMQFASWSGYAKIGHDRKALVKEYLSNIASIVGIIAPVALGIGFTADYFVPIVFGMKWIGTIPLIQILTVAGILRLLHATSGSMYAAIGAPHYITYLTAATMLVQIPALLVGITSAGAIGAALATIISSFAGTILAFGVLSNRLQVGFGQIMRNIWRSLCASAAMIVMLLIYQALWPVATDLVMLASQLALCAVIGAFTYVSVHFALWHLCGQPDGLEKTTLKTAHGAIKELARWRATRAAVEPNTK